MNVDNYDDHDEGPIDYSALDLTLTDEGYRMVKGSVKPWGDSYEHHIKNNGLAQRLTKEGNGYVLKRTHTYLFKLREKLAGRLKIAKIYGQATAKSTIGRMDVLVRLIVDGMDCYEDFSPSCLDLGSGDMYLEITPMTFNVRIKEGISLSQLRLFRGKPEDSEIRGDVVYSSLLYGDDQGESDGSLSADLRETNIRGRDVCAFWAERGNEQDDPIDLWVYDDENEKPSPCNHWKFLKSEGVGDQKRIRIDKTHFYILRSREKIALPQGVAVYCRASDETIGEMRIHYAGFVHPFFGTERQDDQKGTPLIFEVRGHDVNVSLKDGEKMARLIFYRMSEEAKRGKVSYNEQTLELSKIFGKWPQNIDVATDGTVTEIDTSQVGST